MRANELVPILQAAVSPVILVSGVGLLLLSMTNRFGRVVDRSRKLGEARRNLAGAERHQVSLQLEILVRRARLLRVAITLATLSVLLAALLVIALFLAVVWREEAVLLSVLFFIACLASLIGSLLVFLRDINLSLLALKLELEGHATPED